VQIGQIVGAHGIRGQVKVQPLTEFLERFQAGTHVTVSGKPYTIESYSLHKGRPLIKLSGIETMSEAQALQWHHLEVESVEPPELAEDEFLLEDLLGLRVKTIDGEDVGVVEDILESPAHDLLVIGEVLIPFVDEFIAEVNFDTETITVTPIPGLLAED
jgi:16S rRNA processing protein RimM